MPDSADCVSESIVGSSARPSSGEGDASVDVEVAKKASRPTLPADPVAMGDALAEALRRQFKHYPNGCECADHLTLARWDAFRRCDHRLQVMAEGEPAECQVCGALIDGGET